MEFWLLIQVSTLEVFLKGVLIGIMASAPMGPVGILCIRRTLQKGRLYGLVTGAGAALSDIVYALMTGLGMAFAMDFIENEQNLFYMQLFGSVLLCAFGLYMYRSKIETSSVPASKQKGSLLHNFVTAFFVTFSNPLIILLFVALFARFAFLVPEHPWHQMVGYMGIILGAMLWWAGLTFVINKMRRNVSDHTILIFNKVVGCIVIIASLVGAVITIFRLQV